MTKTTRRLGRGLASLISGDLSHPPTETPPGPQASPPPRAEIPPARAPEGGPLRGLQGVAPPSHRLLMISPDRIRRNPRQPRRAFDEASLASLAESMRTRGTLQPVIVRPSEGGYELVAGERRLRAARLAGLGQLPALVRGVPDDQLLELALVENIQRTDLSPVERARAYRALEETQGLSHEAIAARTGEDRATVANYIRLLGLPEEVLSLLEAGRISAGHAKAILGVPDPAGRVALAQRAASEGWSVRRTEQAAGANRGGGAAKTARPKRAEVEALERRLAEALGVRVMIREGRRRHSGRLVLEYSGLDDFERILQRLGVDVDGA